VAVDCDRGRSNAFVFRSTLAFHNNYPSKWRQSRDAAKPSCIDRSDLMIELLYRPSAGTITHRYRDGVQCCVPRLTVERTPARYLKARSSLVRRLVQARDDSGKQRTRAWLRPFDDAQLQMFGLTPEDIHALRF
jgi:hypothetical protein